MHVYLVVGEGYYVVGEGYYGYYTLGTGAGAGTGTGTGGLVALPSHHPLLYRHPAIPPSPRPMTPHPLPHPLPLARNPTLP